MEKQFNLELDANGMVSSREIHGFLGLSKDYTTWIKMWIKNLNVIEGEDFTPFVGKSTGGRRSHDYLVNKDMAMSLVMVSGGQFANQLRKHLIGLFDKRQNLELITPEEAVFATTILEFLQFVNNQKVAYNMHMETYIKNTLPYGNIYKQFHYYRNNIIGWDKDKIEEAVKAYVLKECHPVKSKGLTERLNIIDTPEAIRVAVMDLLLSSESDMDAVNKFANLIKRMAQIKKIEPKRENETNLFDQRKDTIAIGEIKKEIKALN